jgi:hypothetical protein
VHDVPQVRVVLHAVYGEVSAVTGILDATVQHLGGKHQVDVGLDATELERSVDPHRRGVASAPDRGDEPLPDVVGKADRLVLAVERLTVTTDPNTSC